MSPLSTPPPPQQRADHAIAQILQAQVQGQPAGVVIAPPGSGKTAILERVAAFEVGYRHGRAALATQTNVQAYDLARRLRDGFPKLPVCLFITKELELPSWVEALPGLRIARASKEIPPGPGIVVANGARWSWMDRSQAQPFTLLEVDEAYQLADYRFAQIAGLAPRLLLVGDPGQIDPIVRSDIARWACERAGPHVPCPDALFARHSGVWRLGLPVSRRLVPDTVSLIQPAFYGDLPFVSLCPPRGRALQTAVRARGGPLDRAITLACRGRSIVQLEAPAAITGETDARLAQAMVDLIVRLFAHGTAVRDGQAVRALTPAMVGVVCANVRQVAAIRERLPLAQAEILVETANRFQGLERPVMLVYHPLSGRADADQFHLDAGRLCVALSRHRVACFLFARAGIEDQLRRYAPSGARILDSAADPEFEGWSAHLALMQALRAQRRIIPLP